MRFVRAVLARLLPLQVVDAVFSTATFRWARDHDALLSNVAAVLRPGGPLVAPCVALANIERVHAAAWAAGVSLDPTHFPASTDTERRRHEAGFVDVHCWSRPEPTMLAAGEPLVTYLRTGCLPQHLDLLSEVDREPFLNEVARRLRERVIDYVRLYTLARWA